MLSASIGMCLRRKIWRTSSMYLESLLVEVLDEFRGVIMSTLSLVCSHNPQRLSIIHMIVKAINERTIDAKSTLSGGKVGDSG